MPSTSAARAANSDGRPSKGKASLMITLQLPSAELEQYPHSKSSEKSSSKPSSADSPTSNTSSADPVHDNHATPDIKEELPHGTNPEANPDQGSRTSLAPTDGRRRGAGGPRGQKRGAGLLADGQPKPRGKPGPKKRKMDADDNGRPWTTPGTGGAGHKLGPKANQGAINAGLRALDRSGTKCRRWGKSSICFKSFTGVEWALSKWAAPPRTGENHVKNIESGTFNSNSENHQPSSNVGSEASGNQANDTNLEIPSSPVGAATPA